MATYSNLFYDNFALPAAVADLQAEYSFSSALSGFSLSTAKFDGRRSLMFGGSTEADFNQVKYPMGVNANHIVVGFRGVIGTYQSNRYAVNLRTANDASNRGGIWHSGVSGNVEVYVVDGTTATLLFSVAGFFLINEEAYYEMEVYRDGTNGFVGIYRDGDLKGSYSGNTASVLGDGMGLVRFQQASSASSPGYQTFITDFYVAHVSDIGTTYSGHNLGESTVYSAPVDAEVGTHEFTPSAGNNEDNLPIPHNTDTTYNQSNTNDHEDRFTVDLSARPAGTIFAAGVELAVKQAVAGSTEIRSTMSINSVRTTGGKYLPSGTYGVRLSDITQSPGSLTDLDYIGYQNQAG